MANKERRKKVNRWLKKRRKQYLRFLNKQPASKVMSSGSMPDDITPISSLPFVITDPQMVIQQAEIKKENEVVDMNKDPQCYPINFDQECNTLEELLQMVKEGIRFLVEKLLPDGCISILAGESDLGKSSLYTQLALSIISGMKSFLGFKLNTLHNKVLIVSTEDGKIAITDRIMKQMKNIPVKSEYTKNLYIMTTSVDVLTKVREKLKEISFDLVILDAFADLYDGDINTSNKVRIFLNDFSEMIKEFKCAVLIVHHIGKGREGQGGHKNQLLGSVGIEGKARQVLMMSRQKDLRVLQIIKGNYVSEEDKKKTIYLKFDPETLTFSIILEPTPIKIIKELNESAVASSGESRAKNKPGRKRDNELWTRAIALYKEGKKQCEIAKELGVCAATISRWITKYKEATLYDTSRVGEVG
ncbi:MAG: AAA family ATPase [Bacteroidales bacterium]